MSQDKKCFIIMPITTPEPFVEIYRDGKLHFRHVLECLFLPSIEKASFEPIPPIMKGGEIIQAEIIKISKKATWYCVTCLPSIPTSFSNTASVPP